MRALAVLLVATGSLWAQLPVSPSGFGRILFPGGVTTSAAGGGGFGRSIYPGATAPPTAAPVNSNPGIAFVGGLPAFPSQPQQPQPNYRNRNAGIVAVPMYYYTGFNAFDPNWNWGYGERTTTQPARPGDPPVVIVNQYFTGDQNSNRTASEAPVARAIARPEPQLTPTNQDKDIIFMIAMKDHTIYAANAYWVEDNTLNYVTIQGAQNSVSLDLVDRDLSQRLNRDRRVAFGLPAR